MTNLQLQETKKVKLTETQKILEFLSSCFVGVGMKEFYNTAKEQQDALLDLHKPVLKKYRSFYALLLISNINDFNKQIIVYNLLKYGKEIPTEQKKLENEIIFQCVEKMPTQRTYKTFKMLRRMKVNNCRTRWLAQKFLNSRKNIVFDCIKYKNTIKEMIVHNHLYVESEVFDFLFNKKKEYNTKLFSLYLKAKKDPEKIYELPYTIAEGFAAYHKIPRKEFLTKIKKQMTTGEKLRLQNTAKKEGVKIEVDWTKFKLIQLFKYLRTQEKMPDKVEEIIQTLAKRIEIPNNIAQAKVRLVLDNSLSSYGSDEKKYHPISIGQGLSSILEQHCDDYKEILMNEERKGVLAPVIGSSPVGQAVLEALKDKPKYLFIVSDGYENEPAGLTSQLLRIYKAKINKTLQVFHFNPVFAAESGKPRELGENISTVGLRDLNQLTTLFFLLQARENLSKAIKIFEQDLFDKKQKVEFAKLKNYLLTT